MTTFYRFVLPENVNFDDALDVLPKHGYSLHDMDYQAEELFVRLYKKGSIIIDVVTDESVDISFITLSNLDKTSKEMVGEMEAINSQQALAMFQQMDELKASYYVTMSSQQGFNKKIYAFLRQRLHHPKAEIRYHTILSILYLVGLDWKKHIQKLFTDIWNHESVEDNKMAIEEVLKAMDKNNWNGEIGD